MMKIRAVTARIFSYSGRCAKISLEFTDKAPFFADLSVSKTYFTDKQSFFSNLSVNPGPNRLNFYGQTAIFAHFVRNRHFSGKPFTDKLSIFSDLSVNGSDFDKCSAAHHLLNYCT